MFQKFEALFFFVLKKKLSLLKFLNKKNMGYFQKNKLMTDQLFVHEYAGVSKEELKTRIHEYMISAGYRLLVGSPGEGHYEKGNKTMRILFGAFSKYFKFYMQINEETDQTITVSLGTQTTGMSGGLIGMKQVKDELKKMAATFQNI